MSFFIDVIIPIPIERPFTYIISKSQEKNIVEGTRVAVPFGKTKICTGIVVKKHQNPPVAYDAKAIHLILDKTPIIQTYQLPYWQWIADYYMCTLGEVCKAAIPSAYFLRSETYVKLSDDFFEEVKPIEDEMRLISDILQKRPNLRVSEIKDFIVQKDVFRIINKMLKMGYVDTYEVIKEKYKPLKITFIRLDSAYKSDKALAELLKKTKRAPRQHDLLMTYMMLDKNLDENIEQKVLLKAAQAALSSLKILISKGVFNTYTINRDRVSLENTSGVQDIILSEKQQESLDLIKTSFETKDVVLFKGVTCSGKTEVYKKLIELYLDQGQQVLYLLPEIALTTQIIEKLKSYFGDSLSVYHSKYSTNERLEVWQNVLNNKKKAQLIIGTRSAVWLPFSNLGLIVIDEEHEKSYKQTDIAPRFHAREASIVLANTLNAKILLGSATPSLESYDNAHNKSKFGLVQLSERYNNHIPKPSVRIVDLKLAYKKKQMKGYFSKDLLDAIQETVTAGNQVILYQNRRGYAPSVECKTCGHSPHCIQCDVILTYHKSSNRLRCHYCGYSVTMTSKCMMCGGVDLNHKGYGTEQIEAELNEFAPNLTTQRLDFDTTRGKHSYEKIISKFGQQEVQILIGTHMISKGLDFKNVTLVGIMNADKMFHFQDFRAQERGFQTLQQLIGRSGRADKEGFTIIQTYNPKHHIIIQAIEDNYQEMFKEQLEQRKEFVYPPYCKLVKITLKDRDYNKLNDGATWFANGLKNTFGELVLGPQDPAVSRVKNQYLKVILVKSPLNMRRKVKAHIYKIRHSFSTIGHYRSTRVNVDVDCY